LRTKIAYYGDFVAYPIAITTLLLIYRGPLGQRASESFAAFVGGLAVWTLLEYLLHRWALHRMPIFTPMHAAHHGEPLALISTPPWISIPVWIGVILLPLSAATGSHVAVGVAIGVMAGYWWYGIVHHVIHHRADGESLAYIAHLRARHMRHHYSPRRGNFGVTSPVWDYVFGTVINTRREPRVELSGS
jgi:sterol desaturase/sphingolipid hydroxylase (fatty acid hydroxylase superfamily)